LPLKTKHISSPSLLLTAEWAETKVKRETEHNVREREKNKEKQ
jgi:hypothetical protein